MLLGLHRCCVSHIPFNEAVAQLLSALGQVGLERISVTSGRRGSRETTKDKSALANVRVLQQDGIDM